MGVSWQHDTAGSCYLKVNGTMIFTLIKQWFEITGVECKECLKEWTYFARFFLFGFNVPFKNISLTLRQSFTEGGWKLEFPEKNHLTFHNQNLSVSIVNQAFRFKPTAVRNLMIKSQHSYARYLLWLIWNCEISEFEIESTVYPMKPQTTLSTWLVICKAFAASLTHPLAD